MSALGGVFFVWEKYKKKWKSSEDGPRKNFSFFNCVKNAIIKLLKIKNKKIC